MNDHIDMILLNFAGIEMNTVHINKLHEITCCIAAQIDRCYLGFDNIHSLSMDSQCFYMLPFARLIEVTENSFERSKSIVRQYLQRVQYADNRKKASFGIVAQVIDNANMFDQSIMIVMSRERSTAGTILFTSRNVKKVFRDESIGDLQSQSISGLLPGDVREAHYAGFLSYLEQQDKP